MREKPLLTPERLCELHPIDRSIYSDETLCSFIAKFHITEDNLHIFKIDHLLNRFVEAPFENATYLLDRKRPVCLSGQVEAIHRIALEENSFFDNESVFYDLTVGRRVRGTDLNLFVNLLKGTETKLSAEEVQALRSELERLDLFHWTITQSLEENSTDGLVVRIAVEFRDGSVWRLSAAGDPRKAFSGDYRALRKLLLE